MEQALVLAGWGPGAGLLLAAGGGGVWFFLSTRLAECGVLVPGPQRDGLSCGARAGCSGWLDGSFGGGAVLAAVALGAAASRGGVGPCGGPSGAVAWFLVFIEPG